MELKKLACPLHPSIVIIRSFLKMHKMIVFPPLLRPIFWPVPPHTHTDTQY